MWFERTLKESFLHFNVECLTTTIADILKYVLSDDGHHISMCLEILACYKYYYEYSTVEDAYLYYFRFDFLGSLKRTDSL